MMQIYRELPGKVICQYLSHIGDQRIDEMFKLSNNSINCIMTNWVFGCYYLTDQNSEIQGARAFLLPQTDHV